MPAARSSGAQAAFEGQGGSAAHSSCCTGRMGNNPMWAASRQLGLPQAAAPHARPVALAPRTHAHARIQPAHPTQTRSNPRARPCACKVCPRLRSRPGAGPPRAAQAADGTLWSAAGGWAASRERGIYGRPPTVCSLLPLHHLQPPTSITGRQDRAHTARGERACARGPPSRGSPPTLPHTPGLG